MAPDEAGPWTKFAKSDLFDQVDDFAFLNSNGIETPNIPADITQLHDGETAVIVDISGVFSVENGLGLAKIGFRPVPLYNSILETKIDNLNTVDESNATIDALVSGAKTLEDLELSDDFPPAFLLDYKRGKEVVSADEMCDNKWSIKLGDMPDASYMKNASIKRLIIWSEGEIRKDLATIIDSYCDQGIEVLIFRDGQITYQGGSVLDEVNSDFSKNGGSTIIQETIRRFENARLSLLLLVILSFVNLFFMFFVNDAPLLWTAPSIMWIAYLWLSYDMASTVALVVPVAYFIFNLLSRQRRDLMIVALILFGIDITIFYLYTFGYGLMAFDGLSFIYAILSLGLPIVFVISLFKGAIAWEILRDVTDTEYLTYLISLDDRSNSKDNYVG